MIEPKDYLKEFKEYRKHLFKSHAKYILRTFLNPWAQRINPSYFSKFPDLNTLNSGLIVDDRPDEMLRFSVLNTLWMTRLNLPIKIYTTEKAFSQTKDLFSDILNNSNLIEINTLETDKINVSFYNNLLKSYGFWEKLLSKKILIFQTDALLIEPIESSMFDFDYIGALFAKGKSRAIRFPHFNNELSEEIGSVWVTQYYNKELSSGILIGNGGLSIRNPDIMKKICLEETSNEHENEDIFFSRFIGKYCKKIPKKTDARRFSIEADYSESFGFHGSYYYLVAEELANVYDRHIRNIIGLASKLL